MALNISKLPQHEREMLEKVMSFGFGETDAEVIASCILTKKPCTWMNNDEVSEQTLAALRDFLAANNHPIIVERNNVPRRSGYLWDVKVRK